MPIPVFYSPEMHTEEPQPGSPSAGKPRLVVDDWQRHFPNDIELIGFAPATRQSFMLAHEPQYVDDVLDRRTENGFGTRSSKVAATLPWTTGSMLAAARHAIAACDARNERTHIPVACSPTSGFHHAHYASGGGFCTFNGLVVAAMKLKAMGLVDWVGILDCDQHYGDGTQDIIDRLKLDFIIHKTAGRDYPRDARRSVDGTDVKRWFAPLHRTAHVGGRGEGDRGGVLLYQAGADTHIDDPLGGYLTTEQMAERDRAVFRICRMYGIPVAWNLAGGYSKDADGTIEPVLALHRNTMQQCISVWKDGR